MSLADQPKRMLARRWEQRLVKSDAPSAAFGVTCRTPRRDPNGTAALGHSARNPDGAGQCQLYTENQFYGDRPAPDHAICHGGERGGTEIQTIQGSGGGND